MLQNFRFLDYGIRVLDYYRLPPDEQQVHCSCVTVSLAANITPLSAKTGTVKLV
jgi:hypothetical protein